MKKNVLDIICKICDNDIVLKNNDIDLFETGLLDSMTFIELLTEMEEQLNIEIGVTEIKKELLNTPAAIVKFIESKIE